MSLRMNVVAACVGASVLSVPWASAGLVTLSLSNGNDGGGPFNTTAFSLANNSGPGVAITGFTLTVGDAAVYNFDEIYASAEQFLSGNGAQTASLLVGDRNQDLVVTDLFTYAFTNFTPGVSFLGQWDIDQDNGNVEADARAVLFNNGAAPNAVLSVTFSDGSGIDYTFPDLPVQETYVLSIPGPSGALAIGAGVALVRSRRRPMA